MRPANQRAANTSHLDRDSRVFQPLQSAVGGVVNSGGTANSDPNYEGLHTVGRYGEAWRNQVLFQATASFPAASPSGSSVTEEITLEAPAGMKDQTLDNPEYVWLTMINPLAVSVTVTVNQKYNIGGALQSSALAAFTVNAGASTSQAVQGLLMGDALPTITVKLGGAITPAGDVYIDGRWI